MARVFMVLTLLAVLVSVSLAQASTIEGEVVELEGLNAFSATADAQATGGLGKMAAVGLAMAGIGGVLSGYVLPGLLGLGGGITMGFVPRIINSTFDNAAGCDGVLAALAPMWEHVVAGFTAQRLIQDPVFLAAFAGVLVLSRVRQSRIGLSRT